MGGGGAHGMKRRNAAAGVRGGLRAHGGACTLAAFILLSSLSCSRPRPRRAFALYWLLCRPCSRLFAPTFTHPPISKHAHDRVPNVAGWGAERELIYSLCVHSTTVATTTVTGRAPRCGARVLLPPARCVTRLDSKRVVKQADVHVSMNTRARVSDGCVAR